MKRPHIPCLNLPVNSVYCIGRNYAEHAKELGNQLPIEPLVFLKPNNCIADHPAKVILPSYSSDVQHEIELVIAIKKDGFELSKLQANEYIGAFAVGIDMTARDIQNADKKTGKPWTKAKCFHQSAVLSEWQAYSPNSRPLQELELILAVNGEIRQKGSTKDMIFDIPTLIENLSHRFPLFAGDIIFTGTPSGVSRLAAHDQIEARITDTDCQLHFSIQ